MRCTNEANEERSHVLASDFSIQLHCLGWEVIGGSDSLIRNEAWIEYDGE